MSRKLSQQSSLSVTSHSQNRPPNMPIIDDAELPIGRLVDGVEIARPMAEPRIIDNDAGTVTATVGGKEIRGWSYRDDAERRIKMLCAHEFAEGWFQASRVAASSHPQR